MKFESDPNFVRLTTYATAAAFLDAVGSVLTEHEADHHLVLGVAEAAAAGRAPNEGLFAASVEDADGLVLAALMTRERPLLVASDRADIAPAAKMLWDALTASGSKPRFLIGEARQAESIAAEWAALAGLAPCLAMRQRAYRLDLVQATADVSGALRLATLDDLGLVAEWIRDFESEALAHVLPQSTKASAERRIAAHEVYLWCDPEPRTMASSARPTKRAIAVNGVYTPPEWRRRGYATACVAALSELLLQRGFEFCVLYTDLSNPTSNAIYTRIGYRPIRDFLMYELQA
jgi:ribosomal protein S18 acetylase RimI-like enzyme